MAITAMGLGSKSLSGDYNLDPQDQFWSWLHGMAKDHSKGTIFSGFKVEPTDPAGMSVQVGGHALTPDSAVYYGDGTDGNFFSRHNVLFSSDGVPTKVELSGASTSGTTTYYIVSYVMPASSVAASSQTAGTPELVKTMAVTGASYGAPTASEIEAAKASGAEPGYIIWGQVSISERTTTVTSSNITQANDMSGGNMRTSRGLLYDDFMAHYSSIGSSQVNITSSDVILNSITIEQAGTYYVSAYVNPNMNGVAGGDAGMGVALNGKIEDSLSVYWSTPNSVWWIGSQHVAGIMSLSKGDVLDIRGLPRGGKQWSVNSRRRLDAFRIA